MRFFVWMSLCVGFFGYGQTSLKQRLDKDLNRYMDLYGLVGLTASVVVDGELAYTGAFGVKNKVTGAPMTLDAVFHSASVSKPFAATAVMHLVERGKLDLDKPVVTYLPYFKLGSGDYHNITIREILTHRSGMPDVEDYQWDQPQLDKGAAERFVRSIANEKPIGPRGGQYDYSNMAFDVLADVIYKVSGQPYEDYLKQHILIPAGMKNSTFYYPEVPKRQATSPHETEKMKISVRKVYPYNRRHAPSSTLNTTALDLAAWGILNLNRGTINGKRLLKPESYRELFKAQAPANGDAKVGLSWFLYDFEGHQMIGHSGGDPGYRSQFAMIPDKGIAVALLCNSDNIYTEDIRNTLLEAALNLPHEKIKQPLRVALERVYLKQGIDATVAAYQRIKANQPDAYFLGMGQLYYLGYDIMDINQAEHALRLFQLNVQAYPEHTGAQGALGEAYLKTGNRTKAIEHLKKAIELDPDNQRRRAMLKEALAKN